MDGQRVVIERDRGTRLLPLGPCRDVAQLVPHGEPYVGPLRADPFTEHAHHARQHVFVGVRAADTFGELRQHLVRRRALAVDEAVGEPGEPGSDGLERHRDDDGGEHREERLSLPTQAPTPITIAR